MREVQGLTTQSLSAIYEWWWRVLKYPRKFWLTPIRRFCICLCVKNRAVRTESRGTVFRWATSSCTTGSRRLVTGLSWCFLRVSLNDKPRQVQMISEQHLYRRHHVKTRFWYQRLMSIFDVRTWQSQIWGLWSPWLQCLQRQQECYSLGRTAKTLCTRIEHTGSPLSWGGTQRF